MGAGEGAQQKLGGLEKNIGGKKFLGGVKNFLGAEMKKKWGVEQKKRSSKKFRRNRIKKVELTAKSMKFEHFCAKPYIQK